MDDVTEPPMMDLPSPDTEYLDYDEVVAAIDGLSVVDRARLDRLELRHLAGTDFAEGDLLHDAVCAAILGHKNCPRTKSFIAFLAQSMRNIASRQRKKLRRQVPLAGASTQENDGDEEFELEDDKPNPEQELIQSQNGKRAAEVWAVLKPHYRDDEQIQLVLLGWEESMRGKELREFVGVTQDQLDYIVKRLRRIAAKHYPKGVAVMTRKPSEFDRLSKIDEALDESIIEASEEELREDFAEQGHDFDKAVARVGSTIEKAKASAAKMRFELAKREMKEFQDRSNITTLDLTKARRRRDDMVAGDAGNTMMAARKGSKLSDRDEDGVVNDLAQLEALENEANEEGEE